MNQKLTLVACLRLIKIFEDPSNHEFLQLELARAARLEQSVWDTKAHWDDFTPEFPFVSTCMLAGTGIDIVDGERYSRPRLYEWNWDFDRGDNNEGVAILDITEPGRVHYCFIRG
jgi:hypothetical protein